MVCPPALWLTERITTPQAKKINMLQNITQGLQLGTGILERFVWECPLQSGPEPFVFPLAI